MDPNYYQQLQQVGAQAATSPSQWGGLGQAAWSNLMPTQAMAPAPPAYTSEYVIYLQAQLVEVQRRFLELHEKYEELLKFREWTQSKPDENFKSQVPIAKAATP